MISYIQRVSVFLLLVLVFCVLGRDYYYGAEARLEINMPGVSGCTADVYYAAGKNTVYSGIRSRRANIKDGIGAVALPMERVGRVLVCPSGYEAVIRHGHYTIGPGKGELGLAMNRLAVNDVSLRMLDATGSAVDGVAFLPEPAVPGRDGEGKITGGGGPCFSYRVEGCPSFPKRVHMVNMVVAVLLASVASLLISWGLWFRSASGGSKVGTALCALVTVAGLFAPLQAGGPAPLLGTMSTPWCGGLFFPLLLVYPVYLFYWKAAQVPGTQSVYTGAKLCAVLLSAAYLLGKSFWYDDSWELLFSMEQLQVVKFALAMAGNVFLLECVLVIVYAKFGLWASAMYSPSLRVRGGTLWQRYLDRMQSSPFQTSLITLSLAYFPLFLLMYPMAAGYDIHEQLLQYSGPMAGLAEGSIPLNNHQPIAHTLMLHACMWAGARIGVVHAGFALYSCIQLGLLVGAVSYFLHVLVRHGLRPVWSTLVVIYFIVHPVISVFMFMSVKEVLYTSFLLMFMACLYGVYARKGGGSVNVVVARVGLAFSLLGIMVMRNEGCYVMLLSLSVLLVCAKGVRREISACLVLCVGYMLAFSAVVHAFGLNKDATRESLSVPMQQIARVFKERPHAILPAEKAAVEQVVKCPDIALYYAPGCSDPIKSYFNREASEEQVKEFMRAWLAVGIRNPDIYAQAFLNNYYLYFYPDKSGTPIYVLEIGDLISDWQEKLVGDKPDVSIYASLKRKQGLLRSVQMGVFQLPVLRLAWWPCTAMWMLLALLAYVCQMRSRAAFSMLVLPAVVMAVPFAGPTNGDYIRYSYAFFAIMPFVCLTVASVSYQKNNPEISHA